MSAATKPANPNGLHALEIPLATLIARLLARGRQMLVSEARDGATVVWRLPGGGAAAAYETITPWGVVTTWAYPTQPIRWEGHPFTVQAREAFHRPPFTCPDCGAPADAAGYCTASCDGGE